MLTEREKLIELVLGLENKDIKSVKEFMMKNLKTKDAKKKTISNKDIEIFLDANDNPINASGNVLVQKGSALVAGAYVLLNMMKNVPVEISPLTIKKFFLEYRALLFSTNNYDDISENVCSYIYETFKDDIDEFKQ